MKVFAIASAVLSIFASIVTAQEGVTWTKPNNEPEKGNTIYTPGLYQKVPVGKPFEVTWQPTTPGTISIVLYKGPGNNIIPQYAIASRIANSGSYFWTPDTTFPDVKEGYGLRIIVDESGQHQWSTQFGFSNPENPSGTGSNLVGTTTTTTATGSATGTVNTTSTKPATTTTTTGLGSNRTTTSTRTTVTTTASRNSTLSTTTLITSTTEETSTTSAAPTTTTTNSDNAAVATAVSYGMGVIAFAAAGMALL